MFDETFLCITLIILAGAHILEERVAGFRQFLNLEWFNGNKDCPIDPKKGVIVDQIGLFLGLTIFTLWAWQSDWDWLVMVPVGVIAADFVQHSIFSIAKRRYTPGLGTTFLYFAYLIVFFAGEGLRILEGSTWGWSALVLGMAVIAGNYFLARRTVRSGKCGVPGALPASV